MNSCTDFPPCPPCSRAHCFCLRDLCLVFSWIPTDAYTWLRAASRNPYVHIQTVITVIMPGALQHYCYRINTKRESSFAGEAFKRKPTDGTGCTGTVGISLCSCGARIGVARLRYPCDAQLCDYKFHRFQVQTNDDLSACEPKQESSGHQHHKCNVGHQNPAVLCHQQLNHP